MNTPKQSRTTSHRKRILLVDDHPILTQGLAQLINNEPDMEVCGQAADASSALQQVETLKPDLAVVDISLKSSDGINLLKDLKARHPRLLTLVLSMHDESLYAERVLRSGARGYVMKQAPPEAVLAALRRVLSGEIYVSARIASRMLAQVAGAGLNSEVSPLERFSDRELEVFRKIGQGHGTKQIAGELHLSVKTVEAYRANIKEKLKIGSATELIQQATLWVRQEGSQ